MDLHVRLDALEAGTSAWPRLQSGCERTLAGAVKAKGDTIRSFGKALRGFPRQGLRESSSPGPQKISQTIPKGASRTSARGSHRVPQKVIKTVS